jgi:hypothetical protein
MRKLATLVVALGALALAIVTLAPSSAEAGWRRGGWRAPGVNVYVGPRWGWYAPRYRYGGPMPMATPTAITRIGAAVTGAAGIRHARRLGA